MALVNRLDFEQLSISKSGVILGRAINIMDPDSADLVSTIHNQERQVRVMQKECQAYHDMTLLVRAIEALDHWRKVEHDFANKVPRPTSVPTKVKKAFEEAKEAVYILLGGILVEAKDGKSLPQLQTPPTLRRSTSTDNGAETEAADFALIRKVYLTEVLLAYNTMLCTAGHMISRDELLTSMDLSVVIADESTGFYKAFVEAGRMKELVRSFAETSKIMLKLNENGKPRKERKKDMGRSVAIWEISG